MPRVHGMDTDQRRRPHRGGIFSLSTPFQSAANSLHNRSNIGNRSPHSNSYSSATLGNDLHDMEFRGTQTQDILTSSVAYAGTSSSFSNFQNKDGAGAIDDDITAAAMVPTTAMGPRNVGKNNDLTSDDATAESSHKNTDNGQQQEQFEDGMEENDDSDATILEEDEKEDDDGSIDLLADSDEAKASDTNEAKATSEASAFSPTSPATQTLDRLSKFGSQEGGAELCIHLLAEAAESHGNDGKEKVDNDGEKVERGREAREELTKKKDEESEKDEDDDESRHRISSAPSHSTQQEINSNISSNIINHSHSHSNNNSDDTDHNKEVQLVSADLQKRECLHNLKEYFMKTSNSSAFAFTQRRSKHLQPPTVPFCNKCKLETNNCQSQSSVLSLPHHGLCPQHDDFYNSGSYEILNLIIDGNILGCEACMYQFDKGRLNKKLVHGRGCKRAKKGGGGGGGKKKPNNSNSENNRGIGNKRGRPPKKSKQKSDPQSSSSPAPDRRKKVGTSTRPMSGTQLTPPPTTRGHGKNAANNTSDGQCSQPRWQKGPFETGDIVFVRDRTWPGRNDPGGVARILNVHHSDEDGTKKYDVKYVIESRKEKGVKERYVSLHSDYISPTKNESGLFTTTVDIDDDSSCSGESRGEGDDDVTANAQVQVGNNADEIESGQSTDGMISAVVDSNVNESSKECEVDKNKVDENKTGENDHRLSEYEQLRLRNIRRNQARLAQLGLLAHPKTSKNDDEQSSSSNQGISKKGKASIKKRQSHRDIERRTQPKRQKAKRTEGRGGKSRVAATGKGEEKKSVPRSRLAAVSLAEAAELGCKKCTDELQTGEKKQSSHASNCPRKRGTEKYHDRQKDSSTEEESRQTVLQGEGQKSSGGYSIEQQNWQTKTLLASVKVPSIADVAKAGSRKCTLKWQTDEVDPTKDHAMSCPRARKKAPRVDFTSGSRICCEQQQENRPPRKESPVVSSNRATLSTKATKTPKVSARTHQPTPSPLVLIRNNVTPQSSFLSHQPTPSPVVLTLKKNMPPSSPPPLPAWIEEFISEANRHNETVPAPRGSKWLPCPNPWGKIGHEEDDFVVLSPFQSESASDALSVFHHGPNGGIPKRFVANPFEEGSPYHATHRSPARGGYGVLRLSRDRVGLRPWGFTVRLHEFGGACLVDGIEPLSPAEAAVDISGWTNEDSSPALQLHDMIICINGKSVGSMTMPELQIELDVCGPELMLVVSRFDIQDTTRDSTTLEDLAMDWNDIGAGASLKRKRVSFGEDRAVRDLHELKCQSDLQNKEAEGSELGDASVHECNTSQAGVLHEITQNVQQPSDRSEKLNPSMRQTKQSTLPSSKHLPLIPNSTKPVCKPSVSLSESGEAKSRQYQLELPAVFKDSTHHDSDSLCKREPPMSHKYNGEANNRSRSDTQYKKKTSRPTVEKLVPVTQVTQARDTTPKVCNIIAPKPKCQPKTVTQASGTYLASNSLSWQTKTGTQTRDTPKPIKIIAHKPKCQSKTITRARDEPKPCKRIAHKTKRQPKTASRYQKQLEDLSDDDTKVLLKKAQNNKNKIKPPLKDQADDESPSSCGEDEDEDADENPWLGCVCGKTHPHPIKVFWIQCEGCEAWYNVAQECVGFDANAAEKLEEWCCWTCNPPVAGLGL